MLRKSHCWVSLRCTCILLAAVLAGCAAPSSVRQIDRLDAIDKEKPKLLVMSPDVRYYLLTAGGIPEPHGPWTEAAQSNFQVALEDFAGARGTDLVIMPDNHELDETEIAYQKLYSAVGMSILAHHYNPNMKLPTKLGSFDWSLGPGVSEIGERYGADYALFSYYRDYQASGGRIAFAVIAAVAGVGVSTGSESGFAALVDLDTGDIVWFNHVVAGAGELRDENGAHAAVERLFHNLPER